MWHSVLEHWQKSCGEARMWNITWDTLTCSHSQTESPNTWTDYRGKHGRTNQGFWLLYHVEVSSHQKPIGIRSRRPTIYQNKILVWCLFDVVFYHSTHMFGLEPDLCTYLFNFILMWIMSQREPREAHTAMLRKEDIGSQLQWAHFFENFKSSCVIRKNKLYNKERWYMNIKQIFGMYFFSQFEHTMILRNPYACFWARKLEYFANCRKFQ